ncbi:hypothetical protein PGT21_000970 [Puccinia graminis f. sp. tritici]|uniref:Uncharacterized protein n=1 Tax=Puccinia graminis f. sp. tritici TaxID=56615 RepID=A0A5B0MYD4_PUCGR|nr:hypothetical protein PGT21_000970 [Puccinia graminis f. sp. tritici]
MRWLYPSHLCVTLYCAYGYPNLHLPLLYIIQFSLNSGLYLQATPVLVGNCCTTYSL